MTLAVQMSTELKPEPPTGLWRRIAQVLLNDATIDAIFTHARNLVVATLVLAAGIHATREDSVRSIPGVVDVSLAGYFVAAIGGGLILLNLATAYASYRKRGRRSCCRCCCWLFMCSGRSASRNSCWRSVPGSYPIHQHAHTNSTGTLRFALHR